MMILLITKDLFPTQAGNLQTQVAERNIRKDRKDL